MSSGIKALPASALSEAVLSGAASAAESREPAALAQPTDKTGAVTHLRQSAVTLASVSASAHKSRGPGRNKSKSTDSRLQGKVWRMSLSASKPDLNLDAVTAAGQTAETAGRMSFIPVVNARKSPAAELEQRYYQACAATSFPLYYWDYQEPLSCLNCSVSPDDTGQKAARLKQKIPDACLEPLDPEQVLSYSKMLEPLRREQMLRLESEIECMRQAGVKPTAGHAVMDFVPYPGFMEGYGLFQGELLCLVLPYSGMMTAVFTISRDAASLIQGLHEILTTLKHVPTMIRLGPRCRELALGLDPLWRSGDTPQLNLSLICNTLGHSDSLVNTADTGKTGNSRQVIPDAAAVPCRLSDASRQKGKSGHAGVQDDITDAAISPRYFPLGNLWYGLKHQLNCIFLTDTPVAVRERDWKQRQRLLDTCNDKPEYVQGHFPSAPEALNIPLRYKQLSRQGKPQSVSQPVPCCPQPEPPQPVGSKVDGGAGTDAAAGQTRQEQSGKDGQRTGGKARRELEVALFCHRVLELLGNITAADNKCGFNQDCCCQMVYGAGTTTAVRKRLNDFTQQFLHDRCRCDPVRSCAQVWSYELKRCREYHNQLTGAKLLFRFKTTDLSWDMNGNSRLIIWGVSYLIPKVPPHREIALFGDIFYWYRDNPLVTRDSTRNNRKASVPDDTGKSTDEYDRKAFWLRERITRVMPHLRYQVLNLVTDNLRLSGNKSFIFSPYCLHYPLVSLKSGAPVSPVAATPKSKGTGAKAKAAADGGWEIYKGTGHNLAGGTKSARINKPSKSTKPAKPVSGKGAGAADQGAGAAAADAGLWPDGDDFDPGLGREVACSGYGAFSALLMGEPGIGQYRTGGSEVRSRTAEVEVYSTIGRTVHSGTILSGPVPSGPILINVLTTPEVICNKSGLKCRYQVLESAVKALLQDRRFICYLEPYWNNCPDYEWLLAPKEQKEMEEVAVMLYQKKQQQWCFAHISTILWPYFSCPQVPRALHPELGQSTFDYAALLNNLER